MSNRYLRLADATDLAAARRLPEGRRLPAGYGAAAEPFVWVANRRLPTEGFLPVFSPSSNDDPGPPVARVGVATEAQIETALEAALGAAAGAASGISTGIGLGAEERAAVLERAADHYSGEVDPAADLITLESGLCHRQARYEIRRAINGLRAAAEQARRLASEDVTAPYRSPEDRPDIGFEVISEPLRLAIGITPFNHPLNQVVHKVAPSIAAGTPMVLVPSAKTPLSAYHLAEVLAASGLPSGALSVLTGPPQALVSKLVSHPEVELVSFTGSVEVGKAIARSMAASGNELVRYVPELGGNAALVVLHDADLELAARLALGAFDNAGQRCTAIKRLLVDQRVADAFLQRFLPRARRLCCGDPWDPESDLGPVIDTEAARRMEARVEAAITGGAELLLGHQRRGAFYPPTVLDRVEPDMDLVRLETFGPVAPILRIDSVESAIEIVRAGRFRLAGGIVTADEVVARRYADAIGVGQVSWNGKPGHRSESAPFGGFGDSGNGEKEGIVCATRGLRRLRTFYSHRPAADPGQGNSEDA